MYTNKYKTFAKEELNYVNKFTSHHKVTCLIKLDNYCSFWNKSCKFIIDIKKQLEINEINSLRKLIKKMINIVMTNYLTHKPTLIVTNEFNEIGYLFWIYFFKHYVDIPFNNISESLNMKLLCRIPISEKESRFIGMTNNI